MTVLSIRTRIKNILNSNDETFNRLKIYTRQRYKTKPIQRVGHRTSHVRDKNLGHHNYKCLTLLLRRIKKVKMSHIYLTGKICHLLDLVSIKEGEKKR